MTYRMRGSPPSPEISPASSSTDASKCKHHRKTHQGNRHNDDDYAADYSPSQSPYELEEEEEDEQPMNTDDAASYNQSESVNNAPASDQFSSPAPKSIPQSNTFDAIASLNSATNSPSPFQPITQIASYINIAPFPIFQGTPDECPVTHLSRFTKVCRANNAASIEMMMRIFPITLENEAALWYDLNIEPYASLSWDEIKSSFMEAYRRNELVDQFRSELMMINQGGKETVRSYFLRLQWILKRWPDHGLPDSLLKGIFIDGLREDFQDWIIPQKPDSLNDSLRLAFNWEQVQSIRAARRKDLKCGFCDGPHKELGCEIREKMRGLWLKSKEKALTVCSARIESDVAAKELVRSLSMGTSSVVGKQDNVEDEKEEGGMLGWKKKSQCQCWKHQCWKKKFERNNSLVTGNSNAGEPDSFSHGR